jgi:triacylglycerol lipase
MNIVLVHGILGFREKFGIEYFNGVKERLEKFTPNILVAELGATRSIRTAGEALREQILEAFSDSTLDPGQETHIIGHSQGGLDARYILSPANPSTTPVNDLSARIASLTTISAPHLGYPIADLLLLSPVDRVIQRLNPFRKHPWLARHLIEETLDRVGIASNALSDLGTESMSRFNQEFPDNPAVRYFSVAGGGRPRTPETAPVLFGFYLYIKSKTNEANDGLVTVSSALRWEKASELWPADHCDEIGHNLDTLDPRATPEFDYLAGYERIVHRVSTQPQS